MSALLASRSPSQSASDHTMVYTPFNIKLYKCKGKMSAYPIPNAWICSFQESPCAKNVHRYRSPPALTQTSNKVHLEPKYSNTSLTRYSHAVVFISSVSPYVIPLFEPYDERATPSISLISTAICARFAASATRLRSCKNGEVSVLCCGTWTCEAGCCCGTDLGPLDEEDDVEDELGA